MLQPEEIISCFIHITYREQIIHFNFSAVLGYLSCSFFFLSFFSLKPIFFTQFGLIKYRLCNPPTQLCYFRVSLCFVYKNICSRNEQILPNGNNFSQEFVYQVCTDFNCTVLLKLQVLGDLISAFKWGIFVYRFGSDLLDALF